jgi:GNAT superfamily N-acetyltransferase
MAEVRVRVARPDDLRAIVALNHALFQEDAGQRDPFANLNWALEEGDAYFAGRLAAPDHRSVVAEVDGVVVGYLTGHARGPSSLRTVRSAELESLFVQGALRGRGIGVRLVEDFLAWCRERGVERVAVTAYATNEGAIRFYQRLGFAPRQLALERAL